MGCRAIGPLERHCEPRLRPQGGLGNGEAQLVSRDFRLPDIWQNISSFGPTIMDLLRGARINGVAEKCLVITPETNPAWVDHDKWLKPVTEFAGVFRTSWL